ncbi:MAG TPA: hypothetical protein VK590_00130 [Saprospiraceae bacterium]|nr:hypothetical protein [Saprospiraceae bacterium]
MKQTQKHSAELHAEIKEWISQLEFYKAEIKFFQKQLEEIVTKYTSQDVLMEVEHFQNQFIRQIEVTDELRHDIKQEENELLKLAQQNPASDHVLIDDHVELREKANEYVIIITDLKEEFRRFLEKYM